MLFTLHKEFFIITLQGNQDMSVNTRCICLSATLAQKTQVEPTLTPTKTQYFYCYQYMNTLYVLVQKGCDHVIYII